MGVLAESVGRYDIRLYLYCLMQNHVHLVLETPRGNLSRFMQRLQTAYTLYFNRKHNRHGHLMQGRFGASVVDEDEYILKLSRYVHLNPVFVKKLKQLPLRERIQFLRAYPWSSYRSYIGRCSLETFVDYGPVLAMMDCRKRQQRACYRRFVEAGISDIDAAFVESKRQSRLCIGSESYHEKIKGLYHDLIEGQLYPEDVSFRRTSRTHSSEAILAIVCEVLAISPETLLRRQRDSWFRPLLAQILCDYGGLTQRQVATLMQLKSGAAVSQQLKRLSGELKKNPSLKKQRSDIVRRIEHMS